jgi:UDP-GlcNAc:undecaprenyl-phosphate GlcNAc-1-phosphate transferase
MKIYFLLFLIATCSALVLTPIVRRLCQRFGWLDEPLDARRLHSTAVPRLGGVAVFVSVLIGLLPLLLIRSLFAEWIGENAPLLISILVPGALTLMLGAFDDLVGLKPSRKFAGLVVIGIVFYALGGRIENLSIPFVGPLQLPLVIGLGLTVLWVVSIANAFNLLDGMDGLATGAGIFSSVVIMVVSLNQGRPWVTALALVFSGALVGFLRYNFNPASIFLGDSGALFVGFILAALSIEGAQKTSTAVAIGIPLIAFGLPMIDTGFTIVRRFISGKPLFRGDREHIHHMLLERGWSQRRAALVLYGVCGFFGLLTLLFIGNSGSLTGLALLIVGVVVVIGVGQLRYHEIDELKAGLKRNVGERRERGANNIKIRRATRNVAQANTLAELYAAISEVLEIGEFVRAVMIVGRSGEAEWNAGVLASEAGPLQRTVLQDGMIWWHWAKHDLELTDLTAAPGVWTLRLPLSSGQGGQGGQGIIGHLNLYCESSREGLLLDINYLCTMFHQETSRAVERILAQAEADEQLAVRA